MFKFGNIVDTLASFVGVLSKTSESKSLLPYRDWGRAGQGEHTAHRLLIVRIRGMQISKIDWRIDDMGHITLARATNNPQLCYFELTRVIPQSLTELWCAYSYISLQGCHEEMILRGKKRIIPSSLPSA